jgi:uncharacterized protein YecA (UPF0149 family)
MKNNCNYSDEWQPYINDYDKFEYDVKLKDGTMVENCYPNGGKFNSMSDLHNNQMFDESEVAEIRFSQSPRMELNHKVSTAIIDEDYKRKIKEKVFMYENPYKDHMMHPFYFPKSKPIKGTVVEVRTQPKIGRNEICPKCESGQKFKRCCGVGK